MPFILAIVDLLKGIAWPVVVMVVAHTYKQEIVTHVLPRLRKAGPAGIELDPAEEQKKIGSDVVAKSAELQKSSLVEPTPAIARLEVKLSSDLQQIEANDRTPVLVRELAIARLVIAFERIYRVIFGSQLIGLRRLAENYRVSLVDARSFFETYRTQDADAYPLGFDGWLGFLKSQELVSETNGALELTDVGRDFLYYVERSQLPINKPL